MKMKLKNIYEVCEAIKKGNYEIAAHGYRWIDYQDNKKIYRKKTKMICSKLLKQLKIFLVQDHWVGIRDNRCYGSKP